MPNIQKRGNSFKLTVSLGYSTEGKQIRKTTTYTPPDNVSPGKAEKLAEKAFYEFEQKCKGITSLNENMRFTELCDWYFTNYATSELKEVTSFNYKIDADKHIIPVFGNYKLKDITTAKISEFYKSLKLSPSSVKKIHTIFSSIMHCAVKQGFISNNPCQNTIRPKKEYKEKAYLTEDQAKVLIKLTSEYSTFNTAVQLLLYTGMRKGECLGLMWDDIDFDNNTITINHTLSYAYERWFLAQPKTFKSMRTIKFADNVKEILLNHKEQVNKRQEILGESFMHPEMVFTSEERGNYIDTSFFNKKFKAFITNSGLPKELTTHSLRHTNATLLINSGIPLKIISEHLGHCNINVTADTYAHVLEKSKNMVAETLSLTLNS
jgi:integrase